MTIALEQLVCRGFSVPDAVIEFRPAGTLIRGPSDTGKSYIRDCLWYLLGGERGPKEIPQDKGYDTLFLQIRSADGGTYTIKKALNGGSEEVYAAAIHELESTEALPDEIGTLLVSLAGAAKVQILRSMSKRGPLTSGDLRHWFLISQPTMISENSTAGSHTEQPQRRAAFCVFLTGQDDKAIVLAPTKEEKLRTSTNILSIERDLRRVNADIPDGSSKADIQDALKRVDATLSLLSDQQRERSTQLKGIREALNRTSSELSNVKTKLAYSQAMASRFMLLEEKYQSDLDRLAAISDGIAVFETLDNYPCSLCNTPVEQQVDSSFLSASATKKQRAAMKAEASKIEALKKGLALALQRETTLSSDLSNEERRLHDELQAIELSEKKALEASLQEFSVDPKTLAISRSELYSQEKLFEELERLNAELQRLKNLVPAKSAPLSRHTESDAIVVAGIVKELLHQWGLLEIDSIQVDAIECDIRIDGRARLSYGAGKRAIFLAAMSIALLRHALGKGYPHLGFVVLDSPIKSYSDPLNSSDVTVSPTTVRDSFYGWLAKWSGPGQVIVLENELITKETAALLKPTEFFGASSDERQGFFPKQRDNIETVNDGSN
ncbi:AAA family ATPase [Undibacterium terreum]|uniref:Rad50/SbcC-type AAA domain-containing protein n=1 Tax=Undibacterium terreum TaxID=1224302 RepID=A0A916XLA4_9BURK|nr:AAA family ATPase [Undibacterium terreum]GGC83669.1 hypothetical protein GCM10011396_33840 [Undibacterium terreum]